MILVNDDILLQTTTDLNTFVEILKEQVYDEESMAVTDCMIDFLYDVWDRSDKLTQMMHKRINEYLYPVALIEIKETANLSKFDVIAVSKKEGFKPSKADQLAFDDFTNRYFGNMKPLYDRFIELNLE